MPLADKATRMVANRLPKMIDAKTHAVLDYLTAGTFIALGAMFWNRNKRAAFGALLGGGTITALAMLTDYPGGINKAISFRTHGRVDAGLAGLTATLPIVLEFTEEPEAKYFRGMAIAESVVTGLTDFSGNRGKVITMPERSA